MDHTRSGETWVKQFYSWFSNILKPWKEGKKSPVWGNFQSFHSSWVLPASPIIQSMQRKKQTSLMVVALVHHNCSHDAVYTMPLLTPAAALFCLFFLPVGWLHIASLPSSSTLAQPDTQREQSWRLKDTFEFNSTLENCANFAFKALLDWGIWRFW